METTCKTCKHFQAVGAVGDCRYNPPQVTIILIPSPPTVASRGQPMMNPVPFGGFPIINNPEDLWCSKWEPQASKLAMQ